MAYHVEKLNENKMKITVTVPADEVAEACRQAAAEISKEMSFPGFRPGKAPYETVKQRVGEMAIMEHAAERMIRSTFVEAMIEQDLDTVGQPYFTMEKLAPGNDFVYNAEIALMPAVTKLTDWTTLEVKRNEVEPNEKLIDEAKRDLQRMRMKENRAENGHALVKGDKAVVSLTMKKDGVVLEGGEGQNHGVYTDEPYYIEGFVSEIIGMKEGDEKTFTLKFPKDHYQKHIAGKDVDFTVKVTEIYTIDMPAFDDEFAKTLNMQTADEVLEKLRENLREENRHEEERRLEKAVLDAVADKSTFDTIPDLLVNQEIQKMEHELEHHVTQQGMDFEEYLKNIGKSRADLKLDFAAQALQRIKVGLVLREIQKKDALKVEETLVDAELDKISSTFKEGDEARKRIYEPEYREYVERQLLNRQTIDMLKKAMVR